MPLTILYRDDHYVAIDKPSGMPVHRTRGAFGPVVLQTLRDQLGQYLYPVHRLDRATSGVMLFALSVEAAQRMAGHFEAREVEKRYLAVVRGWTDTEGVIDYPLREEKHFPAQSAVTRYRRLATVELPIPVRPYPTSRYSLVEACPETGRFRQIRKHFKHIFHPILGDTSHGDGKHNDMVREQFGIQRLLLMAHRLSFAHPFSGEPLSISAPPTDQVAELFDRFGWRTNRTAAERPATTA